jgi:hypothetical protein
MRFDNLAESIQDLPRIPSVELQLRAASPEHFNLEQRQLARRDY